MTKSNDGWVPELGEECEGTAESGVVFKCRILGVFQGPYPEAKCIVFQYEDGGIEAATEGNSYTFSPIKTEAEKRRESMLEDMVFNVPRYEYEHLHVVENIVNHTCSALMDAGWIKPKPLTEDVICRIHGNLRESQFRTFATRIGAYIRGELEL